MQNNSSIKTTATSFATDLAMEKAGKTPFADSNRRQLGKKRQDQDPFYIGLLCCTFFKTRQLRNTTMQVQIWMVGTWSGLLEAACWPLHIQEQLGVSSNDDAEPDKSSHSSGWGKQREGHKSIALMNFWCNHQLPGGSKERWHSYCSVHSWAL